MLERLMTRMTRRSPWLASMLFGSNPKLLAAISTTFVLPSEAVGFIGACRWEQLDRETRSPVARASNGAAGDEQDPFAGRQDEVTLGQTERQVRTRPRVVDERVRDPPLRLHGDRDAAVVAIGRGGDRIRACRDP